MTETMQSTPAELAERSRELAAAQGLSDGALGSVLLALVERLEAPFAIKDIASGRYVHVSPRMAALYGRSVEELLGHTDADLLGPEISGPLRTGDQAALAQSLPHTIEHRLERDRQRRDFNVTRIALPTADGGPPRHLCSVWVETTLTLQREAQLGKALQQLEQQQIASEALRRETQDQALRDNVTGLYQRIHFEDQLRREVDLSSREHREFALVSIALDPLPDAVRSYGEAARTRVLEALGRLLRGNTRAMDASCRLDEDHFAILLSGVGLATAHSRMEGLRRQCATQIVVLDGRDLGFTVSMGVASFPHTAHTQEELMQAADVALAEAQRRGGNHVTLASIRFDAM
ncbi:GGDEF domain-containing protein [Piscinibacter sp. XHJ-5]|uniref:sensor domain-containing diguanylate cyclase n=1 Tax=Piscinibacter sp. XHJ-5 TaxID=3037797 RepID=UPI0024531248|nr:GGDEF domain-containing protein [Piscinibacter sp. XHJ-5]